MNEYSFSVGNGFNSVEERKEGYAIGCYATRYGFVFAYSQGDEDNFKWTSLQMIKNGRCYVRQFDKRYTLRGIARKANEFAYDLHVREALMHDEIECLRAENAQLVSENENKYQLIKQQSAALEKAREAMQHFVNKLDRH